MSNLEHALHYAALGYHVIPVRENDKRPDCPNGASDGTTDVDQIRAWWAAKPNDNIGIVCRNCLVLDLDLAAGGNGLEDFQNILAEIRGIPTDGPVAVTGGGGQHWFYAKPDLELKASTKITFNGRKTNIDLRTGNTFVVAAPSRHASGRLYEWQAPLVPADRLPVLPEAFFSLFNQRLPARQAAVTSSPITAAVTERCRRYIESIEGAVQGQNGSAKTLHAANVIFFDFGLNEAEGWPILLEYNARCEPPWTERELRHKMDDALGYVRQDGKERGWRSLEEFEDVDVAPAIRAMEEKFSQVFAPTNQADKDFHAWLEARKKDTGTYLMGVCGTDVQIASPSWLWRDHLLAGELTLFAGKGGTGKTTFVMSLAAQLTRGETWPDGSPCPMGDVLYFYTEDRIEYTLLPRFLASGGARERIFFHRYVKEKSGKAQFTFRDIDLLRDQLEYRNDQFGEGAVKAVVFDPITAFVAGDNDNNNAAVRSALSQLPDLLDEFNIACFGIAHTKKGLSALDSAADSVSGAAAYVNLARAVYTLYYDKKDDRRVALPAKWNIGKTPNGIAFALVEKILLDANGQELDPIACAEITDWDYDEDADQYLTRKFQEKNEELGTMAPAKTKCLDYLLDLLATGDRPLGINKGQPTPGGLFAEAAAAGYSVSTVTRTLKDPRFVKYDRDGKKFVTINPTREKLDPPPSQEAAKAGAEFLDGVYDTFKKYSGF